MMNGLRTWGALAGVMMATAAGAVETPLRDVLVLGSPGRPGRAAVHTDAVEAQIVAGTWQRPVAGDSLTLPNGTVLTWKAATADTNGALARAEARSGYVYWPVVSATDQVWLLEAAGHSYAYVNGEIHAGDPYGYGYFHLPVQLHAGTNDLLFLCSRGGFRAKLQTPTGPLTIDGGDPTLPDVLRGESEPLLGAAILLNTTTNWMTATLRANGHDATVAPVSVPPLGTRKAPFRFAPPRHAPATGDFPVVLEATDRGSRQTARADFRLRVRRPDEPYKRTFLSAIDDSVQYYGVNPAPPAATPAQALFLSLHGASVEGMGQAAAYSPKKWGNIISPTNRRPYGFDWEEWGRADAMEVLALATARYRPDPSRIYLTGHSMGGHGTWHLGVTYPDRFAAIAPSAGWISFTTYAATDVGRAAPTNDLQRILRRAAGDDTLLLATNLLQAGVYILHGDADDNVPVEQAREMRQVLGGFHRDFDFFEQPGAGHWWDASDEPGADCVDWQPMFDYFARHSIPADDSVRRVRFTTLNPAVSARSHWVGIQAQEHDLNPSSVDVRSDPGRRRIVGTTTNVARVWFEFPALTPNAPVLVELDGQKIPDIRWDQLETRRVMTPTGERSLTGLTLARQDGMWRVSATLPPAFKNPLRSGPFRQAFYNHVMLVYGTHGTSEENAWALARARFDAESFWYRGNGSLALLSDDEFLGPRGQAGKLPNGTTRNVVLYGHAEANAAWNGLLAGSPVQVHRGAVQVGKRRLEGGALGCLFLQPHPKDPLALVGVVAGSGLPGMRVTERLPYIMAGGGFPDCLIVGADLPTKGFGGVRAAGFFGPDWQVATGEFAWPE